MPDPDIVRWMLDRLLAHDDSITQELALTVELETRAEWGGQRVHVRKTVEGKVGRPPSLPAEVPIAAQPGPRARLYGLLKSGPHRKQ